MLDLRSCRTRRAINATVCSCAQLAQSRFALIDRE